MKLNELIVGFAMVIFIDAAIKGIVPAAFTRSKPAKLAPNAKDYIKINKKQ